jgi:hypothetical protein
MAETTGIATIASLAGVVLVGVENRAGFPLTAIDVCTVGAAVEVTCGDSVRAVALWPPLDCAWTAVVFTDPDATELDGALTVDDVFGFVFRDP